MEHVPIVRIRLPIVPHVMQRQEPHVVNVIRIISLKQQRNVQHVQVRPTVQHVHRHQIRVLNVHQVIIQMDRNVIHVHQ